MKFLLLLWIAMPIQAQTLIIGDSIFALTRDIPNQLEEAGLQVNMWAKNRAKMDDIISQYQGFKAEQGIPKTVIMNGGGNDVFLDHRKDCIWQRQICYEVVESVFQKTEDLLIEMQDDGIERVIFVGIHLFHRWNAGLNPVVEMAMDEFANTCSGYCTFIDLREPFKERGLLMFDDLHPNRQGSRVIADLILDEVDPPEVD